MIVGLVVGIVAGAAVGGAVVLVACSGRQSAACRGAPGAARGRLGHGGRRARPSAQPPRPGARHGGRTAGHPRRGTRAGRRRLRRAVEQGPRTEQRPIPGSGRRSPHGGATGRPRGPRSAAPGDRADPHPLGRSARPVRAEPAAARARASTRVHGAECTGDATGRVTGEVAVGDEEPRDGPALAGHAGPVGRDAAAPRRRDGGHARALRFRRAGADGGGRGTSASRHGGAPARHQTGRRRRQSPDAGVPRRHRRHRRRHPQGASRESRPTAAGPRRRPVEEVVLAAIRRLARVRDRFHSR